MFFIKKNCFCSHEKVMMTCLNLLNIPLTVIMKLMVIMK